MWMSSLLPQHSLSPSCAPTYALPFPPACTCAPHAPACAPCTPPFPPAHACAPHTPACACAPCAPPFPPACAPCTPPFPPAHAGALPCLHPLLSLLCTPPFSPSHVCMSPSGAVPMS